MPNSKETIMYCKLTGIDGYEYIRGPQGQFPMDETNPDYRTYLEWVAEGNTAPTCAE